MKSAPIPAHEFDRLAELYRLKVLDTGVEGEFEEFTRLAAQICGTPIAVVSLVDSERQWFKSRYGLDATETPRDISFCGHAIHGQDVFEVSNALEDWRFADNPLVTQAPDIRFYAGAPLLTQQGHAIGTLCVIDRVPHNLSDEQKNALAILSRQVVRQLERRLDRDRESELYQEISRQAKFQKVLLDSAVAGVISTTAEGVITSFNPAAERMLGYTADELVGKQGVSILHVREELEARAESLSAELGRQIGARESIVVKVLMGLPDTREWHYRRKNGSLLPVMLSVSAMRDDEGALTGFVALAWDISERKLADLALRNSEARLQLAMSAARTSLWDAMPMEGTIALDARWGVMLGMAPQDITLSFTGLVAMVPVEEVPLIQAKMTAVLKGEQEDYIAEHRIRHGDGHWIWIESRGRVIERDAQGRAVRMMGTNTDITERKRLDAMKGEFVSTVSHELRTPLTSISGALGLVCGGALGPVTEQAQSMLDIAYKNSQRLTHLINDLLDMEKLVAGQMRFELETQEIMPLVEQAVESMKTYAQQHQVALVIRQRADGTKVKVDASRLQQVLSNFLSNAAKFSPSGSKVEVSVYSDKDVVKVAVQDRGPGIPEEFQKRIFQKFSQADSSDTRQKGGTGLGLAISKELIERMNGMVGFMSQKDQGARFHFELPLVRGDMLVPTVNADEIPGAPHLLVVEDDPDIARLLVLLLHGAGFNADVAGSGKEALQKLAQRRYVAMTLDLLLPDQSGVSIIRQLRSMKEHECLPIIVVSAYMHDGKLAINGDFAAVDWIDKPVEEPLLIEAVRRCLSARPGPKVKVLHVEDDADLHRIVTMLGRDVAEFDVAPDLARARDCLLRSRYDLVVLDIGLPDGSGWDLLPVINALQPAPQVIVLSGTELSDPQRLRVYQGLLKSHASTESLLDTIRQAIRGRARAAT